MCKENKVLLISVHLLAHIMIIKKHRITWLNMKIYTEAKASDCIIIRFDAIWICSLEKRRRDWLSGTKTFTPKHYRVNFSWNFFLTIFLYFVFCENAFILLSPQIFVPLFVEILHVQTFKKCWSIYYFASINILHFTKLSYLFRP